MTQGETGGNPLHGLPYFVAHTPSRDRPSAWHSLPAHLHAVAKLAGDAAATAFSFCELGEPARAVAHYLGLRHDLGKFTDAFQTYLVECCLADRGKGKRPAPGSAPHKEAGAVAALLEAQTLGKFFAAVLTGHHGGIPELRNVSTPASFAAKTNPDEVRRLRERARAVDASLDPDAPNLDALIASPHLSGFASAEMFFRMLYSCLVDADSLDTEAHHDPEAVHQRQASLTTLASLRETLIARQEALQNALTPEARERPVNQVRRAVYEACRRSATLAPGVFALTVPTGGGKTRSSLAFALEHAVAHDQTRIIYAIPYTSIVDQTAGIFRALFGAEGGIVLEHHSAIEPPDYSRDPDAASADLWRRLAAQNWDAPLIVTTTVQLFESLFSHKPGKCRKLHRLAGSVIVLDEVQTLPTHLLTPLLSGLRTLTENFGVTVVLCTATQPAFAGESPFGQKSALTGFPTVTPIIADPAPHFAALRRVTYRIETETPWDWARVAGEMRTAQKKKRSALCIVNARRQALDLLDALEIEREDPDVLHLSTLLCGRHRRAVLKTVAERLAPSYDGPPILLVSTTVVECGVDLDFPLVLRAEGPLDRIIQAAGRCNREGLRERDESHVIVFRPADGKTPGGNWNTALAETQSLIHQAAARGETVDFDDPAQVTAFFAQFYQTLGRKSLDKYDVQKLRESYDYPEVAHKVRLIEDDTVSVLVMDCPGGEEDARAILVEAERRGRMTRELWQKAQPLSVSLYRRDADPATSRHVREAVPGLFVWQGTEEERYHPKRGLPLPADPGDIVYKPGGLMA